MSKLHYDEGKAGKRKVMLATTVYDRPDDGYTFAISGTREALHKARIATAYCLLQGNCHVDDARNEVVDLFLKSDCDDLIFLDADVIWKPEDVLRLCKHNADIVGGVYPFRRESGDEMPVRMLRGDIKPKDGLLEVEGLPTGFMRIRRGVLEVLAENSQTYRGKDGNVSIVFERTLIDGTRWGGDLNFCLRWRALGGKVFADYDLNLGHAAKVVITDSLGAFLRRQSGSTLRHVADKVRKGEETLEDLAEARKWADNRWGADVDVLQTSVTLARRAKGPIIETGSGLTTVLMAAATTQYVYCLEHSPVYAARLREMASQAGVSNVGLCVCPIKNGWYDLSDASDLPESFALGLNDGPPRIIGDRHKFFQNLDADVIVCDDADDMLYRAQIKAYAASKNRPVTFATERAAIIGKF